jgi:uncharacterized membrane protein YcaP (DUF421 family)
MDAQELLMTAARGLAVYAVMLVVIRLLGKRTVGNFSAFDLLVALMLGEVVDEMIYGDVSFLQGLVAIVTVAAAKYVSAWLSYSSPTWNRILEGTPSEIVRNGAFVKKGLRHELMNEKDVYAALRLNEIRDMREVKRAMVEVDGEVSVLKEDWAEAARKADLGGAAEREKKKDVGDEEEPPEEKATDSAFALGKQG